MHPSISGWQSEGRSCIQLRHGHNCVSTSDVESSNRRSRRKKPEVQEINQASVRKSLLTLFHVPCLDHVNSQGS